MPCKVIGVILIIAAGGLWGNLRSEGFRTRLKISTLLQKALRKTSIMVRYSSDVEEIIHELISDGELTEFCSISGISEHSIEECDILSQLRESVGRSSLNREEKEILLHYCAELGTSDICGQLEMLDSLIASADELIIRRREEYFRNSRLYRSVGLLLGAMAGIAII